MNAVKDSIGNIAATQVGAAANYIESTWARSLSVAINFLGRQVGLGNVGQKVREIIQQVRAREEPRLYYYALKTKSYYKMSITFDEYLELLSQTMGLYYWQEFFIDDSNFRLKLNRAEQFLKDLELLFPEVDRTIFESQLAKRRAINVSYSSQNLLS